MPPHARIKGDSSPRLTKLGPYSYPPPESTKADDQPHRKISKGGNRKSTEIPTARKCGRMLAGARGPGRRSRETPFSHPLGKRGKTDTAQCRARRGRGRGALVLPWEACKLGAPLGGRRSLPSNSSAPRSSSHGSVCARCGRTRNNPHLRWAHTGREEKPRAHRTQVPPEGHAGRLGSLSPGRLVLGPVTKDKTKPDCGTARSTTGLGSSSVGGTKEEKGKSGKNIPEQ